MSTVQIKRTELDSKVESIQLKDGEFLYAKDENKLYIGNDKEVEGKIQVNVGEGGGAVDSVNGKTGVVVLGADDVNAIAKTEKGQANGVATLDSNSKIPANNIPDIAISKVSNLQNELDNKALKSEIPTKVSELENDSNFVDNVALKAVENKVDKNTTNITNKAEKAIVDEISNKVNKNIDDIQVNSDNIKLKADKTELDKKLNLTGGIMQGKIDMASFGIDNLPDAVKNGQPVTFKQLNDAIAGIGTVFNLKGSKPNYEALPKDDNKIGDVWFVENESVGYIWIEKTGVPQWEKFGPQIDLSGYLTKDGLLQTTGSATDNTMSQDAITKELGKKQDKGDYALKSDIPEIPTKLPNPNALTFTGASTAEYDGTKPVSVNIPQGGSEQVQADWNQNDSSKPDYIKNRICYEEEEQGVFVEKQEITMSQGIGTIAPFSKTILANTIYTIQLGEDIYTLESHYDAYYGGYVIGDIDTYNPVGVLVDSEALIVGSVFHLQEGIFSLKITYSGTKVKTLNEKFIPDSIKNKPGEKTLSGGEVFNLYGDNKADSHAHAEGEYTTASGEGSHAEGSGTTASGRVSHAEGEHTTASGDGSHAEGEYTTASGKGSHAEGSGTTASGDGSHAEGISTTASGDGSHAEGISTTASGDGSHAEGINTTASTQYSHAEGINTTASSPHQHVQGKYNIDDPSGKYAHIVGNGAYDARSNAHTLDWQGNSWYQGSVLVAGKDMDSPDAELRPDSVIIKSSTPSSSKRFKITVTDDGVIKAEEVI